MPDISNSGYVSVTMSTEKKMLMYGWVHYHLEKKTFSEMKYVNDSKTAFQVPWIHKSNRKWNENAAAVFKAWAEYKGKEDNFSFTRAKTNFRMAMKYQPNIREVKRPKRDSGNDKSARGTKRKASDEEKCVKVYEIVHTDEVVKKKSKKTHAQRSTSPEWNSQGCGSTPATTSFPSTSSQLTYEAAALAECTSYLPSQHCSEDLLGSLDHLVPSELPGYTTPNILDELRTFLPDDGEFVKLPSCQELLSRKETSEEIPRPYCDSSRYLPLQPIYESISDPVVSSTDDGFKINCSPGRSSDEASSSSGESFSLYPYTKWCQDFESHCQVTSSTNYSGDALGCFIDMEAFERMESYLEEFVRNVR